MTWVRKQTTRYGQLNGVLAAKITYRHYKLVAGPMEPAQSPCGFMQETRPDPAGLSTLAGYREGRRGSRGAEGQVFSLHQGSWQSDSLSRREHRNTGQSRTRCRPRRHMPGGWPRSDPGWCSRSIPGLGRSGHRRSVRTDTGLCKCKALTPVFGGIRKESDLHCGHQLILDLRIARL